jgi:hypothetical protein
MVYIADNYSRNSYIPSGITDSEMQKAAGINSAYEYRRYLQQNAEKIMASNSNAALTDAPPMSKPTIGCGCKKCGN